MKKILLATTMIVGGASIAAAESGVTLSGDARMGLLNSLSSNDTTFTSRARVSFGLAGESDSGLSFGASFRADNASGASSGTAGSVFISGAFGKLSMGDVDGAANAAVGHVDGVGLTGLGDTNENLFIANGGLALSAVTGLLALPTPGVTLGNVTADPSVLYEYSAGAFTVYVSHTQLNHSSSITRNATPVAGAGPVLPVVGALPAQLPVATYEGSAWAVGGAYTLDNYKFSLGYEALSGSRTGVPAVDVVTLDAKHLILGADATFGAVTVKARYGDGEINVAGFSAASEPTELKQAALSATYTMDAISVTAFARSFDSTSAGVTLVSTDAMGLGASYDLGGGAKVVGGIARVKTGAVEVTDTPAKSETAFDIGVSLKF